MDEDLFSHNKLFNIVLAESSLELMPKDLWKHPQIIGYAKQQNKEPRDILLDSSYFWKAMRETKLYNYFKRGRPDIVHQALLLMLDSRLHKLGFLSIYIHTIDNKIVWISDKVRIPRTFRRFVGLMEQLLKYGQVPIDTNEPLLKVLKGLTFEDLIKRIDSKYVIGFSRHGTLVDNLAKFFKANIEEGPITLVIGGFPKGHFSDEILKYLDQLIAISRLSLTTLYVVCTIISSCESLLSQHLL